MPSRTQPIAISDADEIADLARLRANEQSELMQLRGSLTKRTDWFSKIMPAIIGGMITGAFAMISMVFTYSAQNATVQAKLAEDERRITRMETIGITSDKYEADQRLIMERFDAQKDRYIQIQDSLDRLNQNGASPSRHKAEN